MNWENFFGGPNGIRLLVRDQWIIGIGWAEASPNEEQSANDYSSQNECDMASRLGRPHAPKGDGNDGENGQGRCKMHSLWWKCRDKPSEKDNGWHH